MQNYGNPDPQEFGGRRIMIPRVVALGEGGGFLGRRYQSLTRGDQPATQTQVGDGGDGGFSAIRTQNHSEQNSGRAGNTQVGDGGVGLGGAGGDQPTTQTQGDGAQASNQTQVGDGGAGAGGFSAIRTQNHSQQNSGRADGAGAVNDRNVRQRTDGVQASNQTQVGDGGAGGDQPATQAQGDGAGFGGAGGDQPATQAQGDGAGFGGAGGAGGDQRPSTPPGATYDFPPAALRHFDSPPRINPPTSPSNSDASSVSSQPQSPEI